MNKMMSSAMELLAKYPPRRIEMTDDTSIGLLKRLANDDNSLAMLEEMETKGITKERMAVYLEYRRDGLGREKEKENGACS